MAQFMLLLYQNPNPPARSPEDMQRSLEKYMAWAKKPYTLDGKRLGADAGKVIRPGAGQPRTTDGPFSESKEVLGGYYLIEASNYDEAVARTLDHPHLEAGGTVEIRQLWS